ncbi:hypothetical protein RhoFasGS6_03744 [Rhodococcus fascians]|nr:hypothetical protein [Rhodococcus fascians]
MPSARLSKTNGISIAWQAPSLPSYDGDGQANSYIYVAEPERASAIRMTGIRKNQSVIAAIMTSPAVASGVSAR